MLLAIIPRGDVELSVSRASAASVPSQGPGCSGRARPCSSPTQPVTPARIHIPLPSVGRPPSLGTSLFLHLCANGGSDQTSNLALSLQPTANSDFQLLDSVLWTPEQPLKQNRPGSHSLPPLRSHLSYQNRHLFPVAQGTKSRVISDSSHIQHLVIARPCSCCLHSIAFGSCKRFASVYLHFIL